MYDTKDIQVQVGGSDQFGNILAGVDAINYIRRTHHDPDKRQKNDEEMKENAALLKKPMGFTVPLLTTPSGEKFGKSAGNAIWLDQEMTSAFDLYQVMLFFEGPFLSFAKSQESSFSRWRTQMYIAT